MLKELKHLIFIFAKGALFSAESHLYHFLIIVSQQRRSVPLEYWNRETVPIFFKGTS
jgi:hypothetical protein